MKSHLILCSSVLIMALLASPLWAAEKRLTIIHTNDLHSQLLGHSPNIDYTPLITGDDTTVGGWARIATVIEAEKKSRDNPTLVLDAGDFLMGSLFHMVSREEAFELKLMKEMGYEVTTLGNHEFDLRPNGLARILTSAVADDRAPEIVLSNAIFNDEDEDDDTLEELFKKRIVKPYTILEKNGIKIGIFGLMGADAAEKAPFASPVEFGDIYELSRSMVSLLKEKEHVDLIILLSHSGLGGDLDSSEDMTLARQVPGIDVIISGHSHTKLVQPVEVNDTIVVQASANGTHVGVLDLKIGDSGVQLDAYKLVEITDEIPGHAGISRLIDQYVRFIDENVLKAVGLRFYQVIAQTDFDLTMGLEESNLGNLVTDSIRWYLNGIEYDKDDPLSKVRVAVGSNGAIRSPILKGKTGRIAVSDLFNSVPLGVGWDDSMAYPLVSFYIYPFEIKKALEVLTTIAGLKGEDYFLQISGLKFKYNPYRMLFDRVTDIWIEEDPGTYAPLDYSGSSTTLIKVAANIYNTAFLKIVGDYTFGILNIIPKDRSGRAINDLAEARVDADKTRAGIQEVKEWKGLIEYVMTFEDSNGDGLPEIPERYRYKQGRIMKEASLNPISLLVRADYITWFALVVIVLMAGLLALVTYFIFRLFRPRVRT